MTLVAPPATVLKIEHADWLELAALTSPRGRSSVEDLISALRTSGAIDGYDDISPSGDYGSERTQAIAESAFAVIESRAENLASVGSYPFTIEGRSIIASGSALETSYVFMLLLSWLSPIKLEGMPHHPAELFEELSADAAVHYLGGEATDAQVYRFGFPRRIEPSGFEAALNEMCRRIGDGAGARARPTSPHQKDAKLDLAVWIPTPDGLQGKVIGFGQCATGQNWTEKLHELQPLSWCSTWMIEMPPVLPVRMFFTPHSIMSEEWIERSYAAGIVFDRIRISTFASELPAELSSHISGWTLRVFEESLGGIST